MYQLKNNARTTIDGAHNDSTTTISVADASELPTTFPFLMTIYSSDPDTDADMEIVEVTAVSTNDLTVVRGADDTTAVSHGDGDFCMVSTPKGVIEQLQDNIYARFSRTIDVSVNNEAGGTTSTATLVTADGGTIIYDTGNSILLDSNATAGGRAAIYLTDLTTDLGSDPSIAFHAEIETAPSGAGTFTGGAGWQAYTGSGQQNLAGNHTFGFMIRYSGGTPTVSAYTADGTTLNTTTISGLTVSGANYFRAVIIDEERIEYYVNGVLEATLTSNLPGAGFEGWDIPLMFVAQNDNTADTIWVKVTQPSYSRNY